MPDRIARSAPARSMLLIPVPIPLLTQGLSTAVSFVPRIPGGVVYARRSHFSFLTFCYTIAGYTIIQMRNSMRIKSAGLRVREKKEGEE
jgi:hypothetical protein